MNALTIIAAVQAGISLIPEGLTLINQAKELLSASDKAAVQAALDAQADAQHQSVNG